MATAYPWAMAAGAPILDDDPVLLALARAPMGPPDPPEVADAIRRATREAHGFIPGEEVTAEIARRRACEPGT